MRTGTSDLPLHGGRCPRWLFPRMVRLGGGICRAVIERQGPEGLLARLADPHWFQAFSCVIGFDWHSSGTTTVACGALKAAGLEEDGVRIAGGKRMGKRTLAEISGDFPEIQQASRRAAKVDSAAVLDGYSLYHHVIFFTESSGWAVVQQGMNADAKYARRYQWLGEKVRSFVEEPHSGIAGVPGETVDLTAKESGGCRSVCAELVRDDPTHLKKYFRTSQATIADFSGEGSERKIVLPWKVNWKALDAAYEFQPAGFDELLWRPGVGAATVRALALVAEVIYGEPPSFTDPVKFSYAVGGKDGVPFPVDRRAMDSASGLLEDALERARLDRWEKMDALSRLRRFVPKDLRQEGCAAPPSSPAPGP